jgi:hypothetical protein
MRYDKKKLVQLMGLPAKLSADETVLPVRAGKILLRGARRDESAMGSGRRPPPQGSFRPQALAATGENHRDNLFLFRFMASSNTGMGLSFVAIPKRYKSRSVPSG